VYDFHETTHLSPKDEKLIDTVEGAREIDQYVYERMKTDPSLRWAMANGMFTFRAPSPSAWMKMPGPTR
jgi:hypothetical protein